MLAQITTIDVASIEPVVSPIAASPYPTNRKERIEEKEVLLEVAKAQGSYGP